jgi:YidC/Oxa1 family membrane protein insertase
VILPLASFLQPLQDLMESIIKFLHNDVGFGWGMAIVGLTFIVRMALLPLSLRGIKSMRRLQLLAPQIKQLQERYKDDRERQQREMLNLYRENKVNPFSSCLPLLLQFPFFIAIYGLLRSSTFKGDVTASGDPGGFFVKSVIEAPKGAELIVLIVLFIVTMTATMLYTTMMNPTATGGSQRFIGVAFGFIVVPFIVRAPAGLAIYWIATNVWSLGQQFIVQQFIPAAPAPAPEEVRATRAPPPPPRKRKRRR